MNADDEDDLSMLAHANHKRKFAIEVGEHTPAIQAALERGIDHEWIALVDVSPVAAAPNRLMRVFRLTDAGLARLTELKKQKVQQ